MKRNHLTINPTSLELTEGKSCLSTATVIKNPLLTHFATATKWVIYHACVMQYHMYTHTHTEIITVTVMQEIKQQSTARQQVDRW